MTAATWEKVAFSKKIYHHQTFVIIDQNGKVQFVQATNVLFGYEFKSSRSQIAYYP